MTVLAPLGSGTTRILAARADRPRNIAPSKHPIHISVVRALRHSGGRKAGTPLEIASTPVTAAPPEAKALRMTNRPTLVSSLCGKVGAGWIPPPPNNRYK